MVAEGASLTLTIFFLVKNKDHYHYSFITVFLSGQIIGLFQRKTINCD